MAKMRVYEEVPTDSMAQGPEAIREFVAATYASFPTVEVTPRNGFQAEGWAVLEGDFSAISADGKSVSVPFIVIMELNGDVIRRSADYFDLNAVLTQLEAADESTPNPWRGPATSREYLGVVAMAPHTPSGATRKSVQSTDAAGCVWAQNVASRPRVWSSGMPVSTVQKIKTLADRRTCHVGRRRSCHDDRRSTC